MMTAVVRVCTSRTPGPGAEEYVSRPGVLVLKPVNVVWHSQKKS